MKSVRTKIEEHLEVGFDENGSPGVWTDLDTVPPIEEVAKKVAAIEQNNRIAATLLGAWLMSVMRAKEERRVEPVSAATLSTLQARAQRSGHPIDRLGPSTKRRR